MSSKRRPTLVRMLALSAIINAGHTAAQTCDDVAGTLSESSPILNSQDSSGDWCNAHIIGTEDCFGTNRKIAHDLILSDTQGIDLKCSSSSGYLCIMTESCTGEQLDAGRINDHEVQLPSTVSSVRLKIVTAEPGPDTLCGYEGPPTIICEGTSWGGAPEPGKVRFAVASCSLDEGDHIQIVVRRVDGTDGAITVDYATGGGTATAGVDYTPQTGTLTWADGDGSDELFVISTLEDASPEGPETVTLNLSDPTGGAVLGSPSTLTLTIIDDDEPAGSVIEFTAADFQVAEGAGIAVVTVGRTMASSGNVSVDYRTSDGTAAAGVDYIGVSGTLTWPLGDGSDRTFQVPILDNLAQDGPKTIALELSDASDGATLGSQRNATLTITDDDDGDFADLVAGVEQVVSPGYPGAVAGSSEAWRTIVGGDGDASLLSAFLVARLFGAGRVVAMGHDGLPQDISELDNRTLMNNVVDWLSQGPPGAVRYTTGHAEWLGPGNLAELGAELTSRGYSFGGLAAPVDAASLTGVDVLIVGNGWGTFSASEVQAIEDFVDAGGGAFLAGLGWSWTADFETYPMNVVGAPFGLRWVRNIISDPSQDIDGSPIFSTFFPAAEGGSIARAQWRIMAAHGSYSSTLPQLLESDTALRRSYGRSHLLLSQVPLIFPPGSVQRQSLYAFHHDLISGAFGVDAGEQLSKSLSYPDGESAMAYLRERFFTTWVDSLELTAERTSEIAEQGGFPEPYRQLLSSHQVYLQDNTRLSDGQLQVVGRVLDAVSSSLHDLGSISVFEFLGSLPPDFNAGEAINHSRSGVNIFGLEVGQSSENPFPDDIAPSLVDIFTIVLIHELNHVVDARTLSRDPALSARRDALIAAAGAQPLNYLRSMFPPGFFVDAPQEFFASISNQWFSDSEKVFELALRRFDSGRREPLHQALFFAEVYSEGSDQTWFYTSDTSGQLTSRAIPLSRDRGHIHRLTFGDLHYDFERDPEGNVLSYSTTALPPDAAFTWVPAAPQAGEEVFFMDTSSGRPTSWQWDLGDGTTSTAQGAFHTYAQPGTYTVNLTVANSAGSDSTSAQVMVTEATDCVSGPTSMCLNRRRFRIELEWRDFAGNTGSGQVVPFGSDDSGLFWFFSASNWEMLIKVLDGCGLNDHFWVFAAATTDVEYTLRVTDTLSGDRKSYFNPLSNAAAAITDTSAFDTCSLGATDGKHQIGHKVLQRLDLPRFDPLTSDEGAPHRLKADCTPGSNNLCLNQGRFKVEVEWRDFEGNTGSSSVVPFGSDDSGLFWFFTPSNWEMLIKVVNGCGFNDRFWVFAAATTDVEYRIRVTDTETGRLKQYFNALGNAAPAITDTDAFDTCP